jgi:RNA polymerase sigma factor (sigma-70 family)
MMQEVFIAVWENIDSLRSDSTPRQVNRWLQKVMRTVFVRQIRRPRIKAEAQLGEAANVADTADHDRELIEELVSYLPPDDRQILQERFHGYSNAEIAVRMGMKENTLNKRMSRIVTKLKEIYKEIYENKQY